MTIFPENEAIVVEISGNRCVAISNVSAHIQILQSAGFGNQEGPWVRQISSDADRQSLVKIFIGIGALFSAGRDWSPEKLVEHYRENGVVVASYRSISWIKPDQYYIVDHA
jgi:hypothetical protein